MRSLGSDYELDRLTSAAYAFIVTQQSRAAMMERFDHSKVSDLKRMRSYFKRVNNLDRFFSTLEDVEITCGDCREWLGLLRGRDDAFIYLDPPYVPEKCAISSHYGSNSWTLADHEKLVDELLGIGNAKVALSGYDNECYTRLEAAGWRKLFLRRVHVSSAVVGRFQSEFLWVNFGLPATLEAQVCHIDYSDW